MVTRTGLGEFGREHVDSRRMLARAGSAADRPKVADGAREDLRGAPPLPAELAEKTLRANLSGARFVQEHLAGADLVVPGSPERDHATPPTPLLHRGVGVPHRGALQTERRAALGLDGFPRLEADAKERQRCSKGPGAKGSPLAYGLAFARHAEDKRHQHRLEEAHRAA